MKSASPKTETPKTSKPARRNLGTKRVGVIRGTLKRTCKICNHAEAEKINLAIWEQQPDRKIVKDFGLSIDSLRHHKNSNHVELKIVHIPTISAFLDGDAPKATQEYVRLVVRVAKEMFDRGGHCTMRDKLDVLRVLHAALKLQAQHAGKANPQPGEDVGADTDLETQAALSNLDSRLRAAEEEERMRALPPLHHTTPPALN